MLPSNNAALEDDNIAVQFLNINKVWIQVTRSSMDDAERVPLSHPLALFPTLRSHRFARRAVNFSALLGRAHNSAVYLNR